MSLSDHLAPLLDSTGTDSFVALQRKEAKANFLRLTKRAELSRVGLWESGLLTLRLKFAVSIKAQQWQVFLLHNSSLCEAPAVEPPAGVQGLLRNRCDVTMCITATKVMCGTDEMHATTALP